MPWPKQAQLITMHAQLGLQDNGRAIKELIVCMVIVLFDLMKRVFGQ